ncbi:MAG TPA: polyribonucleotide nucleotidyltransferase, partial [Devosia sp.]|nr:polyribonucleotide nucleotidyltransferase [Devosia sp.]
MTINFDHHKVELNWGGQPLTLETGKIARQADGAVLATLGETVLLATVVSAKTAKPGVDFFPLTVNYQEKYFAAGKIPGGYFKREGRPTENETLVSRLIDRPIRPLFPEGYKHETQVVVTVLQHDMENNPDVLALVAASAALTISGIPFMGPIGAARVGYVDGQYVLNLPVDRRSESKLDLVMAGTDDAVLMVESEAKELSEEIMLGAVMFGHAESRKVIAAIIKLAELAAKDAREFEAEDYSALESDMLAFIETELRDAYKLTKKEERYAAVDAAKAKVKAQFAAQVEAGTLTAEEIGTVFKHLQGKVVRWNVLDTGLRIDGRDLSTVRPIVSEVGVLPRTHGSALFTRGETQALVVATLGTGEDEQYIDSLEGTYKQNFLLHYNFPPYSVGEAGRMGSPGRREIGHGKLAWRAINPVRPSVEEFPYTIRIVSEITESNGSSSMATVCGTSLAMMDAGVPLARPVAGIAMGLILEGEKYAVLSDILGDEDHLGDMDFKVAGTDQGVTSLQMDIKIAGITEEIMKIALEQAKGGRIYILGEMAKALSASRGEVGEFAPRIETMKIPTEKIREVIGTGGKVIREIVAETGAKVDIDDEGVIKISSSDLTQIEAAKKWILGIVEEPEVGKIYQGKVVNIVDFGAFVNFMGGKDGLVHVSEMKNERVEKPTDVVSEG